MFPTTVRNAADLRVAREALGLSADGLARMVRVEDGRTVRRWEAGERDIPGPVSVILETALDFLKQKIGLTQQLARLNSGEMVTGAFGWNGQHHYDSDENMRRVEEAIASLNDALAILTRQPPPDGEAARREVHWYTLRRRTPKHSAYEKDAWSMPSEISVHGALAYLEKDTGYGPLEVCGIDDPGAEFVLEQRVANRRQVGASLRTQPGDLVKEFHVRRVPLV